MRVLAGEEFGGGSLAGAVSASDGHTLRLAMIKPDERALGSDDVSENESGRSRGDIGGVSGVDGVPLRVELVTGPGEAEASPDDASAVQPAGDTAGGWLLGELPPVAMTAWWILGAVLLAGAAAFTGSKLWGTVGGVAVMRRIGAHADRGSIGADPDDGNERAFRALAAEGRVSADDRAALRAAAEAMGVPPATLLMSKAVLRRAMDARCEQKLAERVRVFAARRGVRLMGAQTVEG